MKQLYYLLFLAIPFQVLSQAGTLDNNFGNFGIAFSPFITQLSYGQALAVQPDGKILVTGHKDDGALFRVFVTRYDTAGTVDGTFTNVITSIGNLGEYARGITVQNDGKIVVAGHIAGQHSDFLVMRFTTTGNFDTTFAAGGVARVDFQNFNNDEANAVAIQSDGKIIIAGWSSVNSRDIALMRFNANGSVDSAFGINGRVSTDIGNTSQEAKAMKLQPDGKIIVAGFSSSLASGHDLLVARYHSDGTIDSTFGQNGITVTNLNADDDAAFSMAIQPDGKIVTAGYTYTNFTYADNLIVRFDSTGSLDPSFNSNGYHVLNSTGTDNIAYGVLVQNDGKLVITGRVFDQTNMDFHVARLNANGTVDGTFGNAGHVFTPVGIEDDFSLASTLQPDGKILLTGYYTDGGIENFIVARYLNDAASTGLEKINSASSFFDIYPQPAKDFLGIKYPAVLIEVEIYSAVMGLIRTVGLGQNETIDIRDFVPGTYLIEIKDHGGKAIGAKLFVVE